MVKVEYAGINVTHLPYVSYNERALRDEITVVFVVF